MNQKIIQSARLGESCREIDHPSGLKLLLYPMEGFSGAYALFGTKYGSVDTCFKTDKDADFVEVPEGIAHYLEHKLFESEQGDAFTLYAKTGASANAYTSFDRTAYLFSCTENFAESIDILLSFVTDPYFTEETVRKEQGIIGQEIRMYEDSPEWRVFFNMLRGMYHNNPVRIDIAGTVESIAQIDADLLYRCYHTFYNLNNMVLAVAGNFSVDTVLEAADRILKPAAPVQIERRIADEPREVKEAFVEQTLPVALPLFHIGFKGIPGSEADNLRGSMLDEVLMEIIAGECSPLYRKLYDTGLINQTFGSEANGSRDYSMVMFSGESRDPKAVYDAVMEEVRRIRAEGIDEAAFLRCKKAVYGRYVGMYGRTEAMAGLMLTAHFGGIGLYEPLELIANLTIDQLIGRLDSAFDPDHAVLSVVHA